jgi:hypothetical protein
LHLIDIPATIKTRKKFNKNKNKFFRKKLWENLFAFRFFAT